MSAEYPPSPFGKFPFPNSPARQSSTSRRSSINMTPTNTPSKPSKKKSAPEKQIDPVRAAAETALENEDINELLPDLQLVPLSGMFTRVKCGTWPDQEDPEVFHSAWMFVTKPDPRKAKDGATQYPSVRFEKRADARGRDIALSEDKIVFFRLLKRDLWTDKQYLRPASKEADCKKLWKKFLAEVCITAAPGDGSLLQEDPQTAADRKKAAKAEGKRKIDAAAVTEDDGGSEAEDREEVLRRQFKESYPKLRTYAEVWVAYNDGKLEITGDAEAEAVRSAYAEEYSSANCRGPPKDILRAALKEKMSKNRTGCDQTNAFQLWLRKAAGAPEDEADLKVIRMPASGWNKLAEKWAPPQEKEEKRGKNGLPWSAAIDAADSAIKGQTAEETEAHQQKTAEVYRMLQRSGLL